MRYPICSYKTVYPQDIECVWEPKNGKGGIYIGNLEASENLATLKKHGIKAVLTAAKDIILRHPKSQIPYHLHVPGEDHERFDLKRYFDKSIDFIKNTLQETNILVHCMAGVSRSVTLVIAYLMKHHKMSFEQAFESVRCKRKIINPNRGFIKQLQQYERFLQTQAQAMRRSCDNFQARARQDSLKKNYLRQSNIRPSLHQSMKRTIDTSYTHNRQNKYSTVGMNSENIGLSQKQRYNYNYKGTRHIHNNNSGYGSFNDLNRQLDQKIANIRKKYMQATELLNRQQRKRTVKFKPKSYFNYLDKSDTIPSYQDEWYLFSEQPNIKKTMSTFDDFRSSRINSSYLNCNPRKVQTFKYYNY